MVAAFLIITHYLGFMLLCFGVSFIVMSWFYFFEAKILFVEWEIFEFNSTSIVGTALVDWMSLSFSGVVLVISSMVLIYSASYMKGDKNLVRFILMVYLFVLSMVFMIISPNLIMILLGWDGLGLVSYCLVIYYQNVKSSNAGMITVLSNRVGDVALLLGISWMLNFGGWSFFYLQFMFNDSSTLVLTGLVIIAAMTKSAQMPFSAWLPAAMAAPTPVSALVHSSTLVTAGVYLLIRFNYLLGVSSFMFYVGVLTMFMSGLGANLETDLKKIIALSTLSQLGLMMMTISMGLPEFSFFHLLTHALFKSLLFLCAGVFIHSMGDTQDIRLMGGLMTACPVTSFYFSCASMALCGAPFLAGFYSKDLILELLAVSPGNIVMGIIVFLSTMFTLSYSVRLAYYIFFNSLSGRSVVSLAEDLGMVGPMSVLMGLSVSAGGFMAGFYFPTTLIYLPALVKSSVLIGLAVVFLGLFWLLGRPGLKFLGMTGAGVFFMGSMWLLPFVSSVLFMPFFKAGDQVMKASDQGWLEYIGGKGAFTMFSSLGSKVDVTNLVSLKYYIFMFFTGLVLLMLI